jgi:hypothetical protein
MSQDLSKLLGKKCQNYLKSLFSEDGLVSRNLVAKQAKSNNIY